MVPGSALMVMILNVNGRSVSVTGDPTARLSHVLRDELGLTGLKEGCLEGECGACTILVDGAPVHACLMLAFQAQGREIVTVEGTDRDGLRAGLQAAFVAGGAVQCGYCTPGMVMAAEGLLKANPAPSTDEIRHALAGNICRCTGHDSIVRAVAAEAARRREART
ncbi:MAG: (2Fe-2S)-binding protein [Rhizobiales bacterium]|nr:(2Fe-2S)-binding protein [Hyphomicrobiales bacterium]